MYYIFHKKCPIFYELVTSTLAKLVHISLNNVKIGDNEAQESNHPYVCACTPNFNI